MFALCLGACTGVSLAPGSPEHDMLTLAVEGWFETGGALQRGVAQHAYLSEYVKDGLKRSTLQAYLHTDPAKRRHLGERKTRGRKPLISAEKQRVIADALASADMGNEGVAPNVALMTIVDLNPSLTTEQARQHYHRTLRPGHKDVLCKKSVKAQPTTSMRTMVNERGQRRWHANCDHAFAHLETINLPDATGADYDKVKAHFTANYDEESIQASQGSVTVVGAAGAKKHEKVQGGRVSITMMKVGNAAGDSGPFVFFDGREGAARRVHGCLPVGARRTPRLGHRDDRVRVRRCGMHACSVAVHAALLRGGNARGGHAA